MFFRTLLILVLLSCDVGRCVARELVGPPAPAAVPTRAGRLVDSRHELRRAKLGSESRYVLASGRRHFNLTGIEGGVIHIGFGVSARAWKRGLEEAEFAIAVRAGKKIRASLRGTVARDRGGRWRDLTLALPPATGQKTELVLEARSLIGEEARPAEILWTPPVIDANPVPSGKNIILVSIDTLRADHLGCYGYERDTSPNLDRLADEGVRFNNAIASSSWTLPSHASLFTGLDPTRHGSVHAGFCTKANRLERSFDTLAELLWDRGYATAGFTGGGYVSGSCGLSQGFDRFHEQAGLLAEKGEFERSIDAARGWISRDVQQPFFLFLHTYEVHIPYNPIRPYDSLFDRDYEGPYARKFAPAAGTAGLLSEGGHLEPRTIEHLKALYDGEIRGVDQQLSQFIDYLRSSGLAKDTCVIVTSDHGEEFEEHGNLFHNHAKLYDELIRIPLIVWCPSLYGGGRVIEEPVSLADVTPTVLEIAGVSGLPGLDGNSLQPSLANGAIPVQTETRSYVHKSIEGQEGAVVAVRTSQYKLIRDEDTHRVELFDLHADPGETKNISAEHLDVVEELLQVIDQNLSEMPTPRAKKQDLTTDAATAERLRALGYSE